MRKSLSRKTVIIVLALFLTLSVGYALFSETITIEGTATAKGNFDIEATCYTGVAPTGDYDYSSFNFVTEHGYSNDICEIDDKLVSFSTEFAYPGALRYFTIKLTNVGTIPAKVPMSDFYTASSQSYCMDGKNGEKNSAFEDSECVLGSGPFSSSYINMSVLVKPDGTEIVNNEDNLNELMSNFLTANGDVKLEPGASTYVVYGLGFTSKPEDYDLGNNFYVKGTTTFKFDFEQLVNE